MGSGGLLGTACLNKDMSTTDPTTCPTKFPTGSRDMKIQLLSASVMFTWLPLLIHLGKHHKFKPFTDCTNGDKWLNSGI